MEQTNFEAGKGEWLWKLRVLWCLRQVCRKPSLSLTLGFSLLALCLKKTQTKLSFPTAVGLAHQLDDFSDKMHRHLSREITTSSSKVNLSQAAHLTSLPLGSASGLVPSFSINGRRTLHAPRGFVSDPSTF